MFRGISSIPIPYIENMISFMKHRENPNLKRENAPKKQMFTSAPVIIDVTPREAPLCWAGGTLFTLISSLHCVVINAHYRPSVGEVAPFDLD